MKSLLYQQGATNFQEPPDCASNPCRKEVSLNIKKDGRLYQYVLRDKVVPEDPYLVMVKAVAFAIRQREPYAGVAPSRSVLDFLVRQNVVGALTEPPETSALGPPPNQPPAVTIIAPLAGTSLPVSVPSTFVGNASDSDGSILAVNLYVGDPDDGGEFLGTASGTGYYSYTWTPGPSHLGAQTVFAVAVDNQGTVTKTSVSITVIP